MYLSIFFNPLKMIILLNFPFKSQFIKVKTFKTYIIYTLHVWAIKVIIIFLFQIPTNNYNTWLYHYPVKIILLYHEIFFSYNIRHHTVLKSKIILCMHTVYTQATVTVSHKLVDT